MAGYSLFGTFIEACNCRVVCPCWVDDEPDEDHCTGLFAWTFDNESWIGDEDKQVGGFTVVSATVHASRRRGGVSESVIYVDDRLPAELLEPLVAAFAGLSGGPLADLADVTGTVVDAARARIRVEPDADGHRVSVSSAGNSLVHVVVRPKRFDAGPDPLQLQNTALAKELGHRDPDIADRVIDAQRSERMIVNIAPLPGAPVDVVGRSGMAGAFRYRHDGAAADRVADQIAEADLAAARMDGRALAAEE